LLHKEGAWAEVVSGLELEMAERLSMPGERTIFNGPYKTEDDLRRAVKAGVWINVDSFDELGLLEQVAGEAGRPVAFGLRVNAAVTEARGRSSASASRLGWPRRRLVAPLDPIRSGWPACMCTSARTSRSPRCSSSCSSGFSP